MNPILIASEAGPPLVELKQGLVIYISHPPTRSTASALLDIYIRHCGSHIKHFRSTAPGAKVHDWDAAALNRFRGVSLPNLYRQIDWGWMFGDGLDEDSWLFMFHAYRPAQEPGKASFVRFDFPWDVDPGIVKAIALEVAAICDFVSGFGGFYLQGRADLHWSSASFDRIFALSWRYWGAEAHNLDVTVNYINNGFKCVNWLTLIGRSIGIRNAIALEEAKKSAMDVVDLQFGTIFQAGEKPRLGDRNRNETLEEYHALAAALKPFQINAHGPFGGNLWTDENAMDYLQRFAGPI